MPSLSEDVSVKFAVKSDVELVSHDVEVSWLSYQENSILFSAPAQFAYAEVWCSKVAGPSFLYVDDLELVETP